MAGDWIKMEKSTLTKPEIYRLSDLLGIPPDQAIGTCFRFWCWCDEHLTSQPSSCLGFVSVDRDKTETEIELCPVAIGTDILLDKILGVDGFADAMIAVGWLVLLDGVLHVPKFTRHMSRGAKARSLGQKNKEKQRKAPVSVLSRSCPVSVSVDRDKTETREEKRREEVNTNTAPACAGLATTPKVKIGKFIPPTLEEVEQHIREKSYRVDAAVFWNHYEMQGWKISGRAVMKSWRAALAKWNATESQGGFFNGSRNDRSGAGNHNASQRHTPRPDDHLAPSRHPRP